MGFIDLLFEFLGLKQKPKKQTQALKQVSVFPKSSIILKQGRFAFKKKEIAQSKFEMKKKKPVFFVKEKKTAERKNIALQFEVEKVLREALELKKKFERIKGVKRRKKLKPLKKTRKKITGKKFKHLTKQEIEEFRKRLKNKKQLSDFEIERMKEHLNRVSGLGVEESIGKKQSVNVSEKIVKVKPVKIVELSEDKTPTITTQGGLKQSIVQQDIHPSIPTSIEDFETIDDKIKAIEELLKSLETDFLKRRISEQEYRQKAFELKQKLNELHIKKKMQAEKSEKHQKFGYSGTQNLTGQGIARNSEKIDELHGMVQELVKRSKIPKSDIDAEISKIDKAKLFESAGKVVDLIELEQKTQKLMQEHLELERQKKQFEKTEFGTGFEAGVPEKKKEEIKEIVTNLEKQKIITDFDKILELIQKKGKISSSEIIKELKISKQRLNDCLEVLEENKLVRLEFPPIGPAIIFDANYISQNSKAKIEKNKVQ